MKRKNNKMSYEQRWMHNNNVKHSGAFFYKIVSGNERDSAFLLNSHGKNEWPIVKSPSLEYVISTTQIW